MLVINNISKTVTAEASRKINNPPESVFKFVAIDFFDNYQKWAPEVVELVPLETKNIKVGTKGKQVRQENNELIESTFEVTDFQPAVKFVFKGIDSAYQHSYFFVKIDNKLTELVFRFDLSDIDLFMIPFIKLLKAAIQEGVEDSLVSIEEALIH